LERNSNITLTFLILSEAKDCSNLLSHLGQIANNNIIFLSRSRVWV